MRIDYVRMRISTDHAPAELPGNGVFSKRVLAYILVSQASRIFPSGVRMRVNKFCVGGEGKIRLVTVARFSCRLPKIW